MPQRVVCSGKKGELRTGSARLRWGQDACQGETGSPLFLSRALARVVAKWRTEVGQADAGWQGCASLVEWAESG